MRRLLGALTVMLVLAAPALAEAPAAITDDATLITSTGTTLSGRVDLKGAASGQARFVYGTSQTPEQTVTTSGSVSAAVTDLQPNTTYQWTVRIKTTEESSGATKEFTTLPAPPTAQTGEATEIGQTSARLEGTADTKGVKGQVSVVLDGKPIGETTRFGGPYSTVATGLAPGSMHTYRLRVVTTGGTAEGTERSFTTTTTGGSGPAPEPTATASPEPTATGSPGPIATISPELGVRFTVAKRRVTTAGRVIARARCISVACRLRVTGTVKRFGRVLTFRAIRLKAGERARLRLQVPVQLRQYLSQHPRAKATLVLRAAFRGSDGTRRTRTLRVTVRR